MAAKVDLYNSSYGNYALSAYSEIRFETYGEDFGQTSWVTTAESHEIPKLLQLSSSSSVLEIRCGSGGYAVHLAKHIGCQVVGLDINAEGVRNAKALGEKDKLSARVKFEQCDVSQRLPVEDNTFDAIYSNDGLCHVPRRSQVLSDLRRVLKPGGRLLFSDALIIGGLLSHEEIATRSSIGMYFFSPPGENEQPSVEASSRRVVGIVVDARKAGFEALNKTRLKARLRILGILDRAGGIEADQLSRDAAGFRDVDWRAGILRSSYRDCATQVVRSSAIVGSAFLTETLSFVKVHCR